MERIPYDEVTFHPHSFGDPDGRLFCWHGQLYRGISYERAGFFKQLFDGGVIEELADRGLFIGSKPTDLALDGYGMVVRHRCVPFVSYPHEWCAAMFKDAALAYLDLLSELVTRNLTLKDTHPWNLLFEGTRPVYVDLTSIKEITDASHCVAYDKFCRYYLYPLILMSDGQERIARHLLPDYEGISRADLASLTGKVIPSVSASPIKNRIAATLKQRLPDTYRRRLKRGLELVGWLHQEERGQNSQLQGLRKELENISLPCGNERSEVDSTLSFQDTGASTQRRLDRVIAGFRPDSILAIGAMMGDYSRLAALAGNRVVSFSKESSYVTRLYYAARDKKLPLLPLVMDFIDPTPSRGLRSHLSIAAAERLQCDMVLAFGLVDQIVSERSLRFDQVVDGLAQFAKRCLIIDFVPLKVGERKSQACSWYTRENFINALRKKFRQISLCSSHGRDDGLLVCEK